MIAFDTRKPLCNTLPDTQATKRRGYRFTPATGCDDCDGRIVYQSSRDYDEYAVTEFPADLDGRAFKCEKPDGTSYDVLIGNGNQPDICDCRGFERFARCKHIDCIRDIIANGYLADPIYNQDIDMDNTEIDDFADTIDVRAVIDRIRADLDLIDRYDAVARRTLDVEQYAEWYANPKPLEVTE